MNQMIDVQRREEMIRKFKKAREEKRQFINELVEELKEDYRIRTGKEPKYVEVW